MSGNSKTETMTIDDLALRVARGFESIEERMATKEDLKGMATKEDLRRMATKEDLKNLVTKGKLAEIKLELDDIDKKIDRLDFKIEEVRDAVSDLDHGLILDLQQRVGVLEKKSHIHP